ncbi:putative Rab3 GTPase-activating protein regulatory subunit N-terminus [Blattamonas nauphoetae]|uniref:Rab3 GTPase-activating protein regulatory subunit N-terminus n=1 Tax=Blattamonas nauphoetae TaxID=2049346 RepID=A0ABQ9YLA3_9EUKA|nr:putative Rab3 GTPase-activating protein regulatory subunit N-terminus [Blattamonas nauphoetae]
MYAVLTSTPYSHFPFAEKEASPHIVAFSVNGCYAASMDINGKQILFHDILANKCETLLPFPDSFLQEEIITTMAIFDIPTLPPTIQQSKSRETSFSPDSGFFTPNLKPESEYLIFRLVSGGKDPFLAQFNAITEKPSLTLDLLSGAAMGLLNLLGFRKNKPEDEKLFVPPLLTVSASHQLHQLVDSERTCSSLHLSPCGRFLAATDSLGRVSVVESETGQMLHLFKGRRNASIAWLRQKVTDSATNSSRLLLFLVIVSPQRGIVEVFLLPHFSRVGGLNIDGSVRSVQMMYPISITQPLSINEGGPLLSVSPFIANSSFEQPVYLVGNGTVYSLRVSLDPVQSLPSNTSISSPYSSTLITEITGESDTPHPSQAQTPTILLEKPKVIVEKEESSSSETENSEKSSLEKHLLMTMSKTLSVRADRQESVMGWIIHQDCERLTSPVHVETHPCGNSHPLASPEEHNLHHRLDPSVLDEYDIHSSIFTAQSLKETFDDPLEAHVEDKQVAIPKIPPPQVGPDFFLTTRHLSQFSERQLSPEHFGIYLEKITNSTNPDLEEMYDVTLEDLLLLAQKRNEELIDAWNKDQRIRVLKILMQLCRILIDVTNPSFFPRYFSMLCNSLQYFRAMIFERVRFYVLEEELEIETQGLFSQHENVYTYMDFWYLQVSSLSDVVTRTLLEGCLLPALTFISQQRSKENEDEDEFIPMPLDDESSSSDSDTSSNISTVVDLEEDSSFCLKTFRRLLQQCSGISHPIVSSYCRSFILLVGIQLGDFSLYRPFVDMNEPDYSPEDYIEDEIVINRMKIKDPHVYLDNLKDFAFILRKMRDQTILEQLKQDEIDVSLFYRAFSPCIQIHLYSVLYAPNITSNLVVPQILFCYEWSHYQYFLLFHFFELIPTQLIAFHAPEIINILRFVVNLHQHKTLKPKKKKKKKQVELPAGDTDTQVIEESVAETMIESDHEEEPQSNYLSDLPPATLASLQADSSIHSSSFLLLLNEFCFHITNCTIEDDQRRLLLFVSFLSILSQITDLKDYLVLYKAFLPFALKFLDASSLTLLFTDQAQHILASNEIVYSTQQQQLIESTLETKLDLVNSTINAASVIMSRRSLRKSPFVSKREWMPPHPLSFVLSFLYSLQLARAIDILNPKQAPTIEGANINALMRAESHVTMNDRAGMSRVETAATQFTRSEWDNAEQQEDTIADLSVVDDGSMVPETEDDKLYQMSRRRSSVSSTVTRRSTLKGKMMLGGASITNAFADEPPTPLPPPPRRTRRKKKKRRTGLISGEVYHDPLSSDALEFAFGLDGGDKNLKMFNQQYGQLETESIVTGYMSGMTGMTGYSDEKASNAMNSYSTFPSQSFVSQSYLSGTYSQISRPTVMTTNQSGTDNGTSETSKEKSFVTPPSFQIDETIYNSTLHVNLNSGQTESGKTSYTLLLGEIIELCITTKVDDKLHTALPLLITLADFHYLFWLLPQSAAAHYGERILKQVGGPLAPVITRLVTARFGFQIAKLAFGGLMKVDTSEERMRECDSTITNFLNKLDMTSTPEQHLSLLSEFRATFPHFFKMRHNLVYHATRLAMTTYRPLWTHSFPQFLPLPNSVRAAIAFADATLSSLPDTIEKALVTLNTAQVATVVRLSDQAEHFFRMLNSILLTLSSKSKSKFEQDEEEDQIVAVLTTMLGFYIVFPTPQPHGAFSLIRSARRIIVDRQWRKDSQTKGILLCRLLGCLKGLFQDTYAMQIKGITCNDVTKSCDKEYKEDLASLFDDTMDALNFEVKRLQDVPNQTAHQNCIALSFLAIDTSLVYCSLNLRLAQDVAKLFKTANFKVQETKAVIVGGKITHYFAHQTNIIRRVHYLAHVGQELLYSKLLNSIEKYAE